MLDESRRTVRRHETGSPLPSAIRARAPSIGSNDKKTAPRILPVTALEWEDGFRRDRFPDREIALWFLLSEVYTAIIKEWKLAAEERLALFRVVCQCQCARDEHVCQILAPSRLSHELTNEAVDRYYRRRDETAAAACTAAAKYAGLADGVLKPLSTLPEPEGRELLATAAVVLGVDSFTKATSVFYGRDLLEEIVASGKASAVSHIAFLYDSRTDELEYLAAVVKCHKGTCCFLAADQS